MKTFYLSRLYRNPEETIGIISTEGRVICHSLEDEKRTVKVFGETRIPAARYRVTLRTVGGHHLRYSKRFPEMHKGMLWLRDVENFKWILIHIGNNDDDTAGCILTGLKSVIKKDNRYTLDQSTFAYLRLYPLMVAPILRQEVVFLDIRDEGTADLYDWKP